MNLSKEISFLKSCPWKEHPYSKQNWGVWMHSVSSYVGRIKPSFAHFLIKGLSSKGIDSSNNYSFGIREHIVFPEVNFDKVEKIRVLDITIVTTSKNKVGTLELLKEFNFPLKDKKN